MKRHMTRRELLDYAEERKLPVYQIGYCGAANLLLGRRPFAYNSGIYGWNWNAYQLRDCIICTGYRNLVGEEADYDIVDTYEKRAGELNGRGFSEYARHGYALLLDFQAALLNR